MNEGDPRTPKNKKRCVSLRISQKLYNDLEEMKMVLNENSTNRLLSTLLSTKKLYHTLLKYHIHKLPFSIRVYIIDFMSFLSSRFLISPRDGKVVEHKTRDDILKGFEHLYNFPKDFTIFSYKEEKYVTISEYISLMYGKFEQDFTSKIYLIFGYVVYRLNNSLKLIPRYQIKQLYLLNSNIDVSRGRSNFLKNIPTHLRNFCMSDVSINFETFLGILKSFKKLRKFAIKKISSTILNRNEVIMELRKVRVIRIMECGFTSKSLNALIEDNSITRSLNVCENVSITNAGLLKFAENKTITMLCIDDTTVDDNGLISYLAKNESLHEIQVNSNPIGQSGILSLITHSTIRIIEACFLNKLKEWNVVETLPQRKGEEEEKIAVDPTNIHMGDSSHIFQNKISDSELLRNCLTLEKIFLDYSQFNKKMMNFLRLHCHNITTFSASNCNRSIDDDVVEIILKIKKLRFLNLSYNSELTNRTLSMIVMSRKIEKLEYQQRNCNNKDFKILFPLMYSLTGENSIRFLIIDSRELSDSFLTCLKYNKKVKVLGIAGCNKITNFGRAYIKDSCYWINELMYGDIDFEKYWFRE